MERALRSVSSCRPQAHALRLPVQEHVVHKWKSLAPEFHNELLQRYVDDVIPPMQARRRWGGAGSVSQSRH